MMQTEIHANVELKLKFIEEVEELHQKVIRGYLPNITFLSKEGELIDLLEDYPDLDTSLLFVIEYYLSNKWECK